MQFGINVVNALDFLFVQTRVIFSYCFAVWNKTKFIWPKMVKNLRFEDVCCKRSEFKFKLRFKNVGRAAESTIYGKHVIINIRRVH